MNKVICAPSAHRIHEPRRLQGAKSLIERSEFLVLPKGRYAPLVGKLIHEAGIRLKPLYKKRGRVFNADEEYIGEYIYMRDAAISEFTNRVPRSVGFTGTHQITETFRGCEREEYVANLPTILVDGARFAIAAYRSRAEKTKAKIRMGHKLYLCTEYPYVGEQLAKKYGWNVTFEQAQKGTSEIAASIYPHIDGVLCITSSGATLRENNLEILEDNLRRVTIRPIWNSSLLESPAPLF